MARARRKEAGLRASLASYNGLILCRPPFFESILAVPRKAAASQGTGRHGAMRDVLRERLLSGELIADEGEKRSGGIAVLETGRDDEAEALRVA